MKKFWGGSGAHEEAIMGKHGQDAALMNLDIVMITKEILYRPFCLVDYLSMFMLAQCVWHCVIVSLNYNMALTIYYYFLLYRYFICLLEGRCTCDLYRY